MSSDEDNELRDLVAQTLEANGTLGKMRAQLRASVFLALEEQEKEHNRTPFLNKELRSFLATREGKLTASLVHEFLEFFGLEFTLAVFKPETGLNEQVTRSNLLKECNIPPSNAASDTPLLTCLLTQSRTAASTAPSGSGDGLQIAKDLSEKQISDARKKFEMYDKDNSGTIDKDELRQLFLDMFPSFNRNMLERYVNDEFNAADRNFSSSIDFNEFLGMYKRLFLLCRTVVASDVEDIISPSSKPEVKKVQQVAQQHNSPLVTSTPHPPQPAYQNNSVSKHSSRDDFGSDPEEDPFFDDIPAPEVRFNTLSSFITIRPKSSDLSELEKAKKLPPPSSLNGQSSKDKEKQAGSSMSSLEGLPALNSGRGFGGSLPATRPKSPIHNSRLNDSEIDKNLRAIDKRMVDLGLDSQNEEFEYEEDFVLEQSLSQKSNSKAEGKPENGSIAEEVDDEEIEDISIEADDLSRSEKSGLDGLTTDCSVSQIDGGFDYAEDPVLP
ncbi:hypothetical protein BsWGS_12518 [Bradybaena similaris]